MGVENADEFELLGGVKRECFCIMGVCLCMKRGVALSLPLNNILIYNNNEKNTNKIF